MAWPWRGGDGLPSRPERRDDFDRTFAHWQAIRPARGCFHTGPGTFVRWPAVFTAAKIGMTLVEVLVVIAIIALVASLLLPA